jgi:hypothetical protein
VAAEQTSLSDWIPTFSFNVRRIYSYRAWHPFTDRPIVRAAFFQLISWANSRMDSISSFGETIIAHLDRCAFRSFHRLQDQVADHSSQAAVLIPGDGLGEV